MRHHRFGTTGRDVAVIGSVLRHCPVFASDKPAKPAGPAMTKPTNADLARTIRARIGPGSSPLGSADLDTPSTGHGAGANVRDVTTMVELL